MFFYLNKIVWFWLNPSTALAALLAAGLALAARAKRPRLRRLGFALAALGTAAFWFTSTLACVCLLGLPLERPYLAAQTPEALPPADAIVVLGGGVGQVDGLAHPELFDAADRVWHAARLYRAGKAPRIVVSGTNDLKAAVPLLLDLGVPQTAITVDDASRNTYENSRFTERLLKEQDGSAKPSVLLVTSAWHMPRAQGNFAQTGLEVVPAATDFKATFTYATRRYAWDWIAPRPENFAITGYLAKEWLGRLARK